MNGRALLLLDPEITEMVQFLAPEIAELVRFPSKCSTDPLWELPDPLKPKLFLTYTIYRK